MLERLILKFRKWKMRNRFNELDMDMQCTNMTYRQYEVEYNRLCIMSDKLKRYGTI